MIKTKIVTNLMHLGTDVITPTSLTPDMAGGDILSAVKAHPYAGYLLFMMTLVYMLNQVDRYLFSTGIAKPPFVTSSDQGIITGPGFTVTYTLTGVLIAFFGSMWNRKLVLTLALIFWSVMTILTGFTDKFWQVAITRIGQSIGEAGCTPFAAGLISDVFPASAKGGAMSVYNVGIYSGYSASQSAANQIESRMSWKAPYFIFGGIGIAVAILMAITIKNSNPARASVSRTSTTSATSGVAAKPATYKEIFFHWVKSPSLILLCIAGGVRNAGGYVWAYQVANYYKDYRHVSNNTYSAYMSVIPLVGGSLGAIIGGVVSDFLLKHKFKDGTTLGPRARVAVVIVSNLCAAPFCVGALLLTPAAPWGFLCLIGTNLIGEMWIGVTLALVLDLTPKNMRTTSIAIYLFIITNIGGNAPALVPHLEKAFGGADGLKKALLVLYPGTYASSSFFFLVALFFLNRDLKRSEAAGEAAEEALLAAYAGDDDDKLVDGGVTYGGGASGDRRSASTGLDFDTETAIKRPLLATPAVAV